MKGDKTVIDYMNELLAGELAAREIGRAHV